MLTLKLIYMVLPICGVTVSIDSVATFANAGTVWLDVTANNGCPLFRFDYASQLSSIDN